MRRRAYGVFLVFGLLLAAEAARADSLTFTVVPADVSGPAGTTVGWGYTITNGSTTNFLDISSIDSDLFLAADGTPDASVFNLPNVAPTDTVTQAYDPASNLGLFQFTWNPGLATGTMESGMFTLYGAFCPMSDPTCVDDGTVMPMILATTAYSATVTPSGGTPIPEPCSILLLFSGLAGISLVARHRPT